MAGPGGAPAARPPSRDVTGPVELAGGVRALWTGRAEGDLGVTGWAGDPAAVDARRRAVVDLPWSWVNQVHGAAVARAARCPGATAAGPADLAARPAADAQVGSEAGVVLAVFTADCAPVALASPEGLMAAVHAGWRGLVSGVVAAAADAMRALGASSVQAALGPCIRPECYEFGPAHLAEVEAALGPSVAGVTAAGRPALDLPAAVRAAAEAAGVRLVHDCGVCTACSPRHFSHRARGDAARQALAVWRP